MDDANDVHKKVSYSIRDVVKSDKKKGNNPNTTAGISLMKSAAAIKEKQQQQQPTECSSSSSICFEPLCHINTRPIKRFSIASSAILASILIDENDEEEKENNFAPLSPPPSLPTPHYVPEEARFYEPIPISGDVEDILMSATRILTSDDTFDGDSYHRVSVCSSDEGIVPDFHF